MTIASGAAGPAQGRACGEMVARVARHLYDSMVPEPSWVLADPKSRDAFKALARGAIVAMREPTPLMLAHGWAAINKGRARPVDMAPGPALREAFPAMIDGALAEAGR